MIDWYRKSLFDLADNSRTDIDCFTHTMQLFDQFKAETGCDPDANEALVDAFRNSYDGNERRARRIIDILAERPPEAIV